MSETETEMENNRRVKRLIRRLGRTGLNIFILGLGGHTYPVGKTLNSFTSFEDRARLVHHLASSGVNFFDTTWIEEVKLLADSFKRADITEDKFVSLQFVDGLSDPEWRKKLRQEIEVRLEILDYTQAPLFLIGMGNSDISYPELIAACRAMAGLKEERLIQNIGLSCHKVELFPLISEAIQETNLIDYIMIRFNWKYQQANEGLFPVAKEHDVGIIIMKVFCWDCGPPDWIRDISVFDPVTDDDRIGQTLRLAPAQRCLVWSIQNSPCDAVIISMNALWETQQNIQALQSLDSNVNVNDFWDYSNRLWNRRDLKMLSLHAQSKMIRERAKKLLKELT